MDVKIYFIFLCPAFECCFPVWMFCVTSHLHLLDSVVSNEMRLSDGLVVCDLKHRRRVATLCMLHNISGNLGSDQLAELRTFDGDSTGYFCPLQIS